MTGDFLTKPTKATDLNLKNSGNTQEYFMSAIERYIKNIIG